MKYKKQKVYVGLSGGVDSSVSAALLKKSGFDVVGVFIKAWHPQNLPCSWKEERRSAMRVCITLDIPFKTLDLEKEYKKKVVDYMIKEYKEGRTPNPDVMCNKEIKFGSFLKWAFKNGANFVATGHYAKKVASSPDVKSEFSILSFDTEGSQTLNGINQNRDKQLVSREERNRDTKLKRANYELWEGKDKNKDQSYFLWTLTQKQLKHTLFPVGEMQKEQVRKLAKKFNLLTAEKKDSQGLCFLGQVNMKEFLPQYIKTKIGDVLDLRGNIIGHHKGSELFTIGERHGFIITKKEIDDKPMYVVSKNVYRNTITVSSKKVIELQNLLVKKVSITEVNWIEGKMPKKMNLECRFRYRQNRIKCKIKSGKFALTEKQTLRERDLIEFQEPQESVSLGQSLVVYDGEMCLGGGIIEKIY